MFVMSSFIVLVVNVIYPVRFTTPDYRVAILVGVRGDGPSRLVSKFASMA